MKKKIFLIVMFFVLALSLGACVTTDTTAADSEDPVISGAANITFVIGESATPVYTQGVTAYDNFDGNITSKIVIDSTDVDLTTPGTYTVTYTVTDLSGNEAEVSITVTVVDLGAPTITGVHSFVFVFGDDAPNYLTGVTASDDVDGDLTSAIVVDSSAVNLAVAGVYTITYQVTDNAGNASAVYSTFIQVKEHADDADLVPPTFAGQHNFTYTIGISATPDYLTGVSANDTIDGDVTASITVDTSAVDLTTPGTYNIVYTATDESGNESTTTVTITVSLETVAPTISGIRILEYYVNEVPNYTLGVTASDNVDGDLTDAIVVDSTAVSMTTPGRYAVTYTVTDAAGNSTTVSTEIVVAINPINLVPDLTAVYRTYTSGTDNLNPYSETLATASELYGYLTDGLYTGDYDWAAAKQILVDEGFTVTGEVATFDDWYAAGKTAGSLPYNRYPAMAASAPVAMDNEGLVWQITLRDDLQFEDGTPITADTFDYSWSMLLDPKLLNDRASNLYADTDLPLVNAEDYVKQLSLKADALGFTMYLVDGKESSRANSFATTATGHDDWLLYWVETGPYSGITKAGAADPNIYVEYWGTGYGYQGYVLVDKDDNPFYWDANGDLVAPSDGWTYADGTAVNSTNAPASYAGALPAFYTDNGDGTFSRTAVDADGLPLNGTGITQDPVAWSEVGFEVIDTLTFQITLASGKTAWDVMGALSSGITGVVHEASFEAGMNVSRTQTNYGTIDNPLVSYGAYVLSVWESDVLYVYTLDENNYAAGDYRIHTIRYDVIEDQSVAVDEFKAGRLDVVAASGTYYQEFKYNKNLKLTPATTFFRFAFNVEGSDQYDLNPILVYEEFRYAFYYAIDRLEFSTEVRAPSYPTFGFLGPVYLSTEYGSVSYRGSEAGQSVLADLAPDTYGYDPGMAKTLFDAAYAQAVLDGKITDGDKVSVEYKFYDVETNWKVANWVKSTVEAIFNQGEATDLFELKLAAVSSAALNDAWDNGDFEMTFGGWQGLNFDAPSMLGQVYNSALTYMLEKGFDTANAPVSVDLPNSKVALNGWITAFETTYADYLAAPDTYAGETVPTATQLADYEDWVALYDLFDGDTLETTYDELFHYAYGELYNVNDINYAGKTDDFDAITAALEGVLLDQMISIPLFTTVAATVYSTRVVFEANEYHAWMGWGGFKYMYLGTAAE